MTLFYNRYSNIDHSRNSVVVGALMMRPIHDFTIFSDFSCSLPSATDRDIDDFIKKDAKRHFGDKIAVTYGLFSNKEKTSYHKKVLGFATLQNDAINVKLPSYDYPNIPAVKIGRFGIRQELQGHHLGSAFLSMIHVLMGQANNRTGCRFLTLNTYPDTGSVDFYKKNGFDILSDAVDDASHADQIIMYRSLI